MDLYNTYRKVMKAAVSQGLAQIRPQTNLPHDGNKELSVQVLLPIMEKVFDVKKPKAKGTESWIQRQMAKNEYGFRECKEFPPIMRHFVHRSMKEGKPRTPGETQAGYPIMREGETVPTVDDIYEFNTGLPFKKGSTRPSREVPFFRSASADGAVLDLKNACKYLVRVKAKDSPTGEEWNNFAEVLWEFVAYYCHYEGISMTSDMARRVTLYTFYGLYIQVGKDSKKRVVRKKKPLLNWIHRKTSNGRSRFAAKCTHNFAKFISLFNKPENLEQWTRLLTDGGAGTVPMEYLIAIEEGLRNYANDVHTMGTRPLRSPYYWGAKVDKWRKREAYIALVRILLGILKDYRQWDCYIFSDYSLRQKSARTFDKRHFPLSDGDDETHFDGEYEFDWEQHGYSPRKKRKLITTSCKRKRSGVVSTNTATPSQVMVYDVEKDCLVPL